MRAKNKQGVPTATPKEHTIASDFLVYLLRNFDSSEPDNVPNIPASTVTPPNIRSAVASSYCWSTIQDALRMKRGANCARAPTVKVTAVYPSDENTNDLLYIRRDYIIIITNY